MLSCHRHVVLVKKCFIINTLPSDWRVGICSIGNHHKESHGMLTGRCDRDGIAFYLHAIRMGSNTIIRDYTLFLWDGIPLFVTVPSCHRRVVSVKNDSPRRWFASSNISFPYSPISLIFAAISGQYPVSVILKISNGYVSFSK